MGAYAGGQTPPRGAWRFRRAGLRSERKNRMGLLDVLRGKFVDPTYAGVHGGGDIITTRLDAVVKWGRKSSIWPMPFGTACCAIEFMALSASHYDLARFGAEVLRFSPRQADLLFVAGTIVEKEAPILKTIYDQMPEPKWVISMGVCASTGGFYRSYHVMQGIDEIIPVDVYVPGCPPAPEALIAAVMKIQENIEKGIQAKSAQRSQKLGSAGDAWVDRRSRREVWAAEDAARAAQGLPPKGVLPLRVLPNEPVKKDHHG
jgi:NADH-quinone oxidoreductase subunit B